MKNQKNTVFAPALTALALTLALTGCGHTEVLADRPYIPAPESDVYVPEGRTAVMPAAQNAQTPLIIEETDTVEKTETTTQVVETDGETVTQTTTTTTTTTQITEPSEGKSGAYKKFVGTPGEPRVNSGPRQQTAASSNAVAGNATYVVRKGDSLSVIAQRHGVKTADLAAVNGLTLDSKIKVGQKLKLPAGAKNTAAPAATDGKTEKSANSGSATGVKPAATAAVPADGVYTVQKNDSLWLIARRFDTTVAALCELNNITPDKKLQVGQKLKVAKTATATTAPATTKPATTPAVTAPTTTTVTTTVTTTAATVPTTPAATTPATTAPTTPAVTAPAATTPAPASTVEPTPEKTEPPVTEKPTTQTYVVQRDISVDAFCKVFKIREEELKKLNPDLPENGILRFGQSVVLPVP